MNFLGHSFVAAQLGRSLPSEVLGAMLPDFTSMSRNRIANVEDGSLADGVALHHATDNAFHRHPIFVALERASLASLEAAGVRRGPSMAAAHIGTELLLDGWCLRRGDDTAGYVDALRASPAALEPLRLRDPEGRPRLVQLIDRIRGYGLAGYDSPQVITDRIVRALSGRPRLAIHPDEVPTIERVLAAHGEEVARDAETLFSGVVARLQ